MAAYFYLGRDNAVTWRLLQDGDDLVQGVVTRAVLWLPSAASPNSQPVILDTDEAGDPIEIDESVVDQVRVKISPGELNLKEGTFVGLLTIFDQVHTDGVAWTAETIRVENWPISHSA